MDDEIMGEQDAEMAGAAPEEGGAPGAAGGPGDDALEKLRMAGRKILYSQPTSDKVVSLLQSAKGNPPAALALTALFVTKAMAQEVQGKMPPEAAARFRDVLLADLAELADASGIDVGEQDVDRAKVVMDQTLAQIRKGGAKPPGAAPQPGPMGATMPQAGPQPLVGAAPGGLIGGAMHPRGM